MGIDDGLMAYQAEPKYGQFQYETMLPSHDGVNRLLLVLFSTNQAQARKAVVARSC